MNRKYLNVIVGLLITSLLCACASNDEYMTINGVKIKAKLVDSGYYLDKASLSEVQLKDAIDRIVTIEKPNPLGTVEFSKKIEDITIDSTNPTEVTQQEVEAKVEEIRDDYQEERIVTQKRPCANGDTVILNYTGKIDGVEFAGGKAVDEEITLGEGKMLEDFEKGIIGHRAGANFAIPLVFPKDYPEESLRGKKAIFSCLIKYIREKVTPEFDDEFAIAHSKTGATTSEAYRKEIEDTIKFRHEYAIKEQNRTALFNEIYQISVCTPSEDGLAWQFSKLITEQKRLADLRDVSYQEQMTNGYYTLADVLLSYKMQAGQYMIEPMILDELQRKYNIDFTEEDKMQWFNDLCVYNDYGSDVTYKLYSNSMGEPYIQDNARRAHVMDEVLKKIKINIVENIEQTQEQ